MSELCEECSNILIIGRIVDIGIVYLIQNKKKTNSKAKNSKYMCFQHEINLQSHKCFTFGNKQINKQIWWRGTYSVQPINARDAIRCIPYHNLMISLR